jgi:uncharacterized protein
VQRTPRGRFYPPLEKPTNVGYSRQRAGCRARQQCRSERLGYGTVDWVPAEAASGLVVADPYLCYKYQVLKLEWDRKKAVANARKHGVSFEEAATCFDDARACYLRNEAPSYEDRLILIGLSSKRRLLFVVHAEVRRDAIRIVSARKASPAQRRIYDEELD